MADNKALTGDSGFRVRVVTPTGTAREAQVQAVTGPGWLGEFEVLPGHVPYLTELHPGVLVLTGDEREYLAVGRGYLKVGDTGSIEVLVDRAVKGDQVDVEAARELLDEVGPKVDDWKGTLGAEYQKLKTRRDWAQAQLDAHARASN